MGCALNAKGVFHESLAERPYGDTGSFDCAIFGLSLTFSTVAEKKLAELATRRRCVDRTVRGAISSPSAEGIRRGGERVSMPSLTGLCRRLYAISEQQGHALAWQSVAIAARAWLLFRVVSVLAPETQAVYFTLVGLLGFQIAFELGLGFLMQTSASHEFSSLRWDGDLLTGPIRNIERLKSLFRLMIRWLGCAAGVMFLILSLAAVLVYRRTLSETMPGWWVLVAASVLLQSIDLPLQGCVAFLSGLRNPVLQTRNIGLSSVGISLFVSVWLAFDDSAFCLPFGLLGSQLTTFGHLFATQRRAIATLLVRPAVNAAQVAWRSELWPVQWRMAISWLTGAFYFFYLPSSILPAYGAIAAAQFGLTNTLLQAAQSLSSAVTMASAPAMATLAATRSYGRLDKLAIRIWWQTSVALLAVLAVIVLASAIAPGSGLLGINIRLLPWPLTALLCVSTLTTHHSSVIGTYLRSHKYEPLAPLGVLASILSAGWTTYACRHLTLDSLILGVCVLNVVFGFMIVTVATSILRSQRGLGDAVSTAIHKSP
jgi:hypothetical protein